ncbi:MAG: BamA/TamA family outer membrane protein [Deltaproteobacteria bacterium]|nr:BamA/TamA family outer membrane protein [Deltaproteobacteria bacterium]
MSLRARLSAAVACITLSVLLSRATVSVAGELATNTKLIPLPIYATLPNEGDTFGFMPVFLTVENVSGRTRSIVAPSLSWNRIIRFTHTFRFYYYPSDDETINLIPSFSTNVNRGLTFEYFRAPRTAPAVTIDGTLHARRSIFYRFFGLGPESKAGDETSYTRVGGDLGGRLGYNLLPTLNVGVLATLERDLVERRAVDFLPLTNDHFPGAPGLGGATTLFTGASLRLDTRPKRQYSSDGLASEAQAGIVQGFSGAPAFGRFSWEGKALFAENSLMSGGARAFWGYSGGRNIPFYLQSSLGGSYFLRGFTEDRFIDKGAWELELEQRIKVFKTTIYGVLTDWRIDPFIAVGQVYSRAGDMFRHVRVTGGLGFRAFVHPNVLGRVDTAVGGEGVKVYVELGYPF